VRGLFGVFGGRTSRAAALVAGHETCDVAIVGGAGRQRGTSNWPGALHLDRAL
jgi:hypothetical protein